MGRRSANKRVTLKDVAEHASVSIKTASNVKNDWPYVSDETRSKVKSSMRELGYRPSKVARSLVTGRSETIGVIIPDITNPFFSNVIRGCENQLFHEGYSLFLCNTDENTDKEEYYIDLLINQGVDGLLLLTLGSSAETIAQIVPDDVPIISVDGVDENGLRNVTTVNIDNQTGAYQATEHLLASGRRRIAFLNGEFDRQPVRTRVSGFQQALQAHGFSAENALIIPGMPTISGGYQAATTALTQHNPDALFCFNDLMALGALAAADTLQRKVPDDVAVVGFDDIIPVRMITPLLTTVRIAQHKLGTTLVHLLMERLKTPTLPRKNVLFPVELQIRESCGTHRFSAEERHALYREMATAIPTHLSNTTQSVL